MAGQEKYIATLERAVSNGCTMIFFLQGMGQLLEDLRRERVEVEAAMEETATGVLGMLAWQMEKTLTELVRNGYRPQKQS
jgi:hypothetical protein